MDAANRTAAATAATASGVAAMASSWGSGSAASYQSWATQTTVRQATGVRDYTITSPPAPSGGTILDTSGTRVWGEGSG